MAKHDAANAILGYISTGMHGGTAVPLAAVLDRVNEVAASMNSLSEQRLCVLNLILWKQYGELIASFVQAQITEGMSSGENVTYVEAFHALGWHRLHSAAFQKALITLIVSKLLELSEDIGSDEQMRPPLDEWLEDELFPYANKVLGEPLSAKQVGELRSAATSHLALERARTLFEMVAEYPDSMIGLKELRDCLKRSDTVGDVGQRFRTALQKRLLHMGASTTQILDFYVSMIKALRILDPSDFLLNYVAAPVRKYLLTRKDAVRCIVGSLTEGRASELHGELKQGGNLAYAPDEDDEEGGPGANWEPRKRNKELAEHATKKDTASKGLDTLALLVSIYGSTDMFIVEYRSLLADKLIANTTYATDNEVANLELLKIRYVSFDTVSQTATSRVFLVA
jgi:hypothetical protein